MPVTKDRLITANFMSKGNPVTLAGTRTAHDILYTCSLDTECTCTLCIVSLARGQIVHIFHCTAYSRTLEASNMFWLKLRK